MIRTFLISLVLVGGHALAATAPTTDGYDRARAKEHYRRPAAAPFPSDNAYSKERAELGKKLFFDTRVSGSGLISCASCHNPSFSWGDGLPKAVGYGMKQLGRRTPTVLNTAWADLLFWDGRAGSLEEQALGPITSPGEMNQPIGNVMATVKAIEGYRKGFEKAYPGEPLTEKTLAKAIATFERTVVSGTAPFDRWIGGDERAISDDAKRGFDVFNTRGRCAQCHEGWNFTDNGFHDIGVRGEDRGRGKHLNLEAMQYAFKTPTLRNSRQRAPFMHDGSEATLASVIDFYDKGAVERRPSLSPEIVPLHLSAQDKADLEAFLLTLESVDPEITVPVLPR
jgi:cytochrome c peroxidase